MSLTSFILLRGTIFWVRKILTGNILEKTFLTFPTIGKTMMRRSDEVTRTEVRSLQMNLAAVHEAWQALQLYSNGDLVVFTNAIVCSLQSLARALVVYGYQHMHDVKVVECALNAVFSGVMHLNHWRLRVLLNILSFKFSYQYK